MDFAVASRSKVWTLQDLVRRKTLKFIVVRLVSSILLRLAKRHEGIEWHHGAVSDPECDRAEARKNARVRS